MVFGLNEKGFIIPLMIRLRLENAFGEFGVSAHLTKVDSNKEYIFLSNEGNILDVSENLFDSIFLNIYPLCNKICLFFPKVPEHNKSNFNYC